MLCHTEIGVTGQTLYLTKSQYTGTGPTSPSSDPIYMFKSLHGLARPGKKPVSSGIRTQDFPLSRRTPYPLGQRSGLIIIIIIIIAFKGAIRDFLQSPHSAENRLQHARSSGPGGIVCNSRATQRALITCNMSCYVPLGTKGQLSY